MPFVNMHVYALLYSAAEFSILIGQKRVHLFFITGKRKSIIVDVFLVKTSLFGLTALIKGVSSVSILEQSEVKMYLRQ